MKRKLLFYLFFTHGIIFTQIVDIPDDSFKIYLVNNSKINTNRDDEIQVSEAKNFTGKIAPIERNIRSLKGIEAFTSLTELDCNTNLLTSLDLSENTALKKLDCSHNNLTSLNISKNIALKKLTCFWNNLTSLDVSNNIALTELDCHLNPLTSLDVSKNITLKELYCEITGLTNLDISKNTVLTHLDCNDNKLTSLDVSKNTVLTYLRCNYNEITNLDVSKNTVLTHLDCNDNKLTSLDISKNKLLTNLDCSYNNLTSLNIANGNNINLELAYMQSNKDLKCINVDINNIHPKHWVKDYWVNYSSSCFVKVETPKIKLKIPNCFSPNGDGVNDIWVIKNINQFPKNNIEIFNRWGIKVYNETNYQNKWNGIATTNTKLPTGTYFYIIKLKTIYFQGWVYISN